MSVIRTTTKPDLPQDKFERITKAEALNHQWDLIHNWENTWDVWSLRFGGSVLGVTSVISSVYINNHFRRKLKLLNFNRFSSYLPTVALPAIMTTVFHTSFITPKIILPPLDDCPACTQTQAVMIQTGFGVLYPCILGPISSFMLATRHYTYRLPGVTENPKELIKIAGKILKPIRGQVSALLVFNAFLAAFMTYKEYNAFYDIQQMLLDEEAEEDEAAK